MSKRDDLKALATDLGIEYKGNISTVKLQALVDEAGSGFISPLNETPPAGPATKAEPEQDTTPSTVVDPKKAILARKRAAFKTRIVTITNKDNRENDVMTTVFLSCHNQHFAIAKYVPLDIPVELEQCLIDTAESIIITLHKDEVVHGQRTGNKIPTRVQKFAISYSSIKPK